MANKARIKHTLEQLMIDETALCEKLGSEVTELLIEHYRQEVKSVDPNFIPSTNKVGKPTAIVEDMEDVEQSGLDLIYTANRTGDDGELYDFSVRGMIETACQQILGHKPKDAEEYAKMAITLMDMKVFQKSSKAIPTVLLKLVKQIFPEFKSDRKFREAMSMAGYGRYSDSKIEDFFSPEEKDQWIEVFSHHFSMMLCQADEIYNEESGLNEEWRNIQGENYADYLSSYYE